MIVAKILDMQEAIKKIPALFNFVPLHVEDPLGNLPDQFKNMYKYDTDDIVFYEFLKTQIDDNMLSFEFIPIPILSITTPNFRDQQFYLDDMNIEYAHRTPGGKGENITIVDVEYAWNFEHEDNFYKKGTLLGGTNNDAVSENKNHGTAVMGMLCGDNNELGVLGICPEINFFGYGQHPISCIKTIADKLLPGDIILIEFQMPGPRYNYINRPDQLGCVPPEFFDSIFNQIKYATDKGVIVIEGAANGEENLDDPIYQRKFDKTFRDSGAIIVGACHNIDKHVATYYTGYGSIVDCHGYGFGVVTTGYGDLCGPEYNRYYTKQFRGTSSAAPMIAGICACVNGIRKAQGQTVFTPIEMRDFIKRGAVSCIGDKQIGSWPDFKSLVKILTRFPDYNGDNLVDFSDFVEFARLYNNQSTVADLNFDGKLDNTDFDKFRLEYYGKQW